MVKSRKRTNCSSSGFAFRTFPNEGSGKVCNAGLAIGISSLMLLFSHWLGIEVNIGIREVRVGYVLIQVLTLNIIGWRGTCLP